MTAIAADLLVESSTNFLRKFPPFNHMEDEALAFVAERAVIAFHPRGTDILTPEMGVPRHFYIIQRGKVHARQTGAATVTEYASQPLAAGECFPIGALSARRPSTNAYVAAEDSFCWQIGADDFLHLMKMSRVFHLYCTQYIAGLLSQSRQQLQTSFSQRAAEQQTMTTALAQLITGEPICVTVDTPARSALEQMNAKQIGCMVVVNDERHPIGVLTQSDLLPRVILADFELERPIGELMTANPYQLAATASAYDAALEMATHGVRHLLVVDAEGRLKGVVSERDLFSLQRISLRQVRAGIENAAGVDALQRASKDIRQLALSLIAQGIGAEQLTRFISALNDALTRRIIQLALEKHDLAGIEFGWMALGSEGRHEQTLSTDQDNGLIWRCPEWEKPATVRSRLIEFAQDVNTSLAACGFPLCKGNIMASNPKLCLTLDEWKSRFGSWIREPHPEALLNATIFFDFRVLYGNERLGDQLRTWLNKTVRGNSAFLRMMAGNALTTVPPLGRLRDFVVEDNGSIDLKKSGARLFVDVARILALRTGVDACGTAQRLRQASSKMGISVDEVGAIIDGFHFIQLLRLRSQHLDTEHDSPDDNRINPDALNELDRSILKEAFRQARKLQSRLKLDYQL
ncbi:MAG TPA: DUF294 nucleotidyltransferase-like domain-containing protein [Thauera sp.]|nr:DUF294 nucleotidyltransferase-like domain-containing protein [Thauera sp.]HRA79950.1 DUF294 nucleotidyltransferase-like domain-containing protein [Thauera sp.]